MPRNVSIKNLAEIAVAKAARPETMKPHFVDGRWQKPKLSAMAIARMRKRHIQQGLEWKWDIPHKIVEKRMPFKGKLRDARKKEKEAEIMRCMARMPKMVAEYRKKEKKRRADMPKNGLIGLEKLLHTPLDAPGVFSR